MEEVMCDKCGKPFIPFEGAIYDGKGMYHIRCYNDKEINQKIIKPKKE